MVASSLTDPSALCGPGGRVRVRRTGDVQPGPSHQSHRASAYMLTPYQNNKETCFSGFLICPYEMSNQLENTCLGRKKTG